MTQDAIRIQAEKLQKITEDIFTAAGTPRSNAGVVARILVGANLTGHDSHGVLRIPSYLEQIASDEIKPDAEPEVIRETESLLVLDGHHAFGHYTAHRGMELAIAKAKAGTACHVAFHHTGHIGRLGEYAEQAAHAGCIGLIYYGMGRSGGRNGVVPYGGAEGRLGTNPMAAGIPTGDDTPFVLDFATSVVAEGKLRVARSKGQDLPQGYIVDKEGRPSTKPADFYDGGFLLPMGGHKGYGLSLLITLLGALAGEHDLEKGELRGTTMQVINVEAFTPLAGYQQATRIFLDWMKDSKPAEGFDEVLVPGDFEKRTRTRLLADGIDIPATIVAHLRACAEQVQVAIDL